MCMCILHIVFCTVCKYVLSICKLFLFFALFGARSQEFHSPRHLCCGDVTIKVIWFDLIWFPLCSANALCLVFIQQDEKVSFWTICLHVPLLDCVSLLVQWCQVRPDVFQWDMRVNSHQGASTRLSLWESARGGPAVTEVRTDGHCFTHMLPSNNKNQHVTLLSSTCSIFALI